MVLGHEGVHVGLGLNELHLVHARSSIPAEDVEGNSANVSNDKADGRVQWGKEEGPYARLWDGGGEGESRYGVAARAVMLGEEPSARLVVDGRRGFGVGRC